MTEIPEHLRKRAEEARAKAAAEAAPAAPAASEAAPSAAESKIPAHLLERAKAARAKAAGGEAEAPAGGGGTAVATASKAPVAAASGPPLAAIQDVKASPQDKVHVWPHLLSIEFVAALICLGFTFIFSVFVNAPLLELADINKTPNPSKAPWYFLGLQEMLTMFHPMVAGVLLPGMGLAGLALAPYIDRNPSTKPEDRKFAISLFTMFMMGAAVLTLIGSFFRGPGQNFVFPWHAGLFFEL